LRLTFSVPLPLQVTVIVPVPSTAAFVTVSYAEKMMPLLVTEQFEIAASARPPRRPVTHRAARTAQASHVARKPPRLAADAA
jgi:hypothetical protein